MGYPGNQFPHVYAGGHIRKGQLLHHQQSHSDDFFNDDLDQKWEEALLKHFGHDQALLEFANDGVMP
jgi:hypothetical protein